jgi:sulfite exporter TauE/SafE
VVTYVTVGAAVGGLGLAVSQLASGTGDQAMENLARAQVVFSLVAAAILLLMGLSRIGLLPEPAVMKQASLPGFVKDLAGSAREGRPTGVFVLGLVLGFLPCGLSWAAFARALPAGGILEGAALVGAFALGTVPGLLGLGTAGAAFARKHRKLSDLLSGVVMVGMAASLAVDGLQALA